MKKRIVTLITAGLMAVCACVSVSATEMEKDSAGNVAVAGDNVKLPDENVFGAFAAGQSVDLSGAEADGSVMAAGQQVMASSLSVGESLYVAGNILSIDDAEVDGNIFAAGNSVSLTGKTSGKGVYIFANSVVFEGEAKAVYIAGNTVSLKGAIDGDVTIEADTVSVEDGTEISGDLKIKSPHEPEIGDDVSVGDYSFDKTEEKDSASAAVSIGAKIFRRITKCIYWIVAMAAFGMLLCWLFGSHLTRATEFMKTRPAAMVVSGIAGWIAIPVAALLLCISYICAPIGGMLVLAYVLLLCAGLAFAGASLSRLVFPKMNVFLAALIGIAVLEAVRMIPVIGTLVGIAADMYLLGYVIQSIWLGRLKKEQ